MDSIRVDQGPFSPSFSTSVAPSPFQEYFDYSAYESLEDMADSLSWSSDVVVAGPQMSFNEGILHVQSVEVAAVSPNTASSSFGQGVGHIDALLLSDPGALVTSVSENSKEATPVCDTHGILPGTGTGNIAVNANDQLRFVCQTCGQSYGRLASLTRHMQAKHHSVTHSCSYCRKTYDRYDNMKRHEKTHHRADQDSPSSGRATRLQSPAIRPMGIDKSQRGGRVPARRWDQQHSPQMNPAQAQRAMQLMGELFLIMGGRSL